MCYPWVKVNLIIQLHLTSHFTARILEERILFLPILRFFRYYNLKIDWLKKSMVEEKEHA